MSLPLPQISPDDDLTYRHLSGYQQGVNAIISKVTSLNETKIKVSQYIPLNRNQKEEILRRGIGEISHGEVDLKSQEIVSDLKPLEDGSNSKSDSKMESVQSEAKTGKSMWHSFMLRLNSLISL